MKKEHFSKKPTYRKTMYFSEEFVPEMENFLKNIRVDPRLSKTKFRNDSQRYSKILRVLIFRYNREFSEFLKQRYKDDPSPTPSVKDDD